MKKYYVYQHRRLDTNEIFYVGIGTKNEKGKYNCKIYSRGYLKAESRRSKFWRSVYSVAKKIKIEIVFETTSLKEVKLKEIELISFYGRRDLGKGTLVNHTDGGDGSHGYKWSEEQKKNRSDLYKLTGGSFKGKKHTQENIDFFRQKAKEQYKTSKLNGFRHTIESKKKLSDIGKERAKKGTLPVLPIMSGEKNHFAKKFIVISPENEIFEVIGGIKKFCEERNLSYDFCKKFLNKGKCYLEDSGRAREKAKNTVGWEFKIN